MPGLDADMSAGNFDSTSFDIKIGGFDGDSPSPITRQWGRMRNRRKETKDDEEDIQDIVAIAMQAQGEDDGVTFH